MSADNLEVQAKRDGTWLTFRASDGKVATLRVESMPSAQSRSIIGMALRQWCADRQSERHRHVAGTTIGEHIDTCAQCGKDIRDPIHLRADEEAAERVREQEEKSDG